VLNLKIPQLKKLKVTKKVWMVLIVAGIAAAFYLFASSKEELVETAACRQGLLTEYISLQGKVELDDLSYIYARTGGVVVQLTLQEGQQVEAGQTAALLDDEDAAFAVGQLSAAVGQTGATVRASQEQAALAASYADKMRQLYEAGGISQQNYADAAAAAEVAAAQYQQAQAANSQASVALAEAQSHRRRTRVSSLVAGTILEKLVEEGTAVAPGTPLYSLGNVASAYLTTDVLSEDAYKLQLGQKVIISGDAIGGKTFPGKISFIAPAAKTHLSSLGVEQQRVEIRVTPSNPIPGLKKGYAVELEIIIEEKADALFVPEAAMFVVGDRDAVFVLTKGRIELREVVTGLENDDFVEIVQGVALGELVVLDPPDSLTDGMRGKNISTTGE
jgi:HlyD family secretion protein